MEIGICCKTSEYSIANEIGYDFVEFAGTEIMALSEDEFANVVKEVSEGPIKCKGFNSFCGDELAFCGDRFSKQAIIDYTTRMCERGVRLGIDQIGIGAPKARIVPPGFPMEKAIEQGRESIKIIAETAKDFNLIILAENVNKTGCDLFNYLTDAVEIARNSECYNMKVVADYHHMVVMEEGPNVLTEAIDVINHTHISRDTETHGKGYLVWDEYDLYKSYIEMAYKLGYNKTLSLEAFDGDFQSGAKMSLEILRDIQKETEL